MDRMGWAPRARHVLLALAGLTLLTASPSSARPEYPTTLPHDEASCARPSLWVVSDADTTIYLFGTIHTHDGRTHWFDHAVRLAFDASSTLVLETLIPTEPPRPVAAPQGSGLSLAKATVQSARQAGLSVQFGADMVLARAADADGKPIIGLESFDEQLRMYQSLPSPARPAAAAAAVAPPPHPEQSLAPYLRTMVDGWNRGDSRPIEAVVGAVRTQSPQAYRRLFTDRNTAWAQWIAQRLEQPGTVFVAVGTGHLVGSDSVQAKLAAAGIRSGRIN
ncbi:hypothetical protein GGQ97_001431 [Sphingomonas kaistensis]|uniref:TraB/GumN family protein n=1 Tax=Sphingomonas kaistensis TaxID=298708 RepID=A0A7X5Y5L9_9SPHN|nr:TraB/GumN family protein [Sphingomonas kaistensis]NJC05638.1 hypothetical protein [Sphingomonas kaistensis]